jgi:hypothetical protein
LHKNKRGSQKLPRLFFLTAALKIENIFYCYLYRLTKKSMKYSFLILGFLLFFSCKNNEEEYHKPESAIDAGREFIQQTLKGKFNAANQYMLQDEDNQFWLAKWSKEFNKSTEQDKAGYSKAAITIYEVTDVIPDSVTIINFSNSYKNRPQKVKVVKSNGEWKVDFKYTFSGNL